MGGPELKEAGEFLLPSLGQTAVSFQFGEKVFQALMLSGVTSHINLSQVSGRAPLSPSPPALSGKTREIAQGGRVALERLITTEPAVL